MKAIKNLEVVNFPSIAVLREIGALNLFKQMYRVRRKIDKIQMYLRVNRKRKATAKENGKSCQTFRKNLNAANAKIAAWQEHHETCRRQALALINEYQRDDNVVHIHEQLRNFAA